MHSQPNIRNIFNVICNVGKVVVTFIVMFVLKGVTIIDTTEHTGNLQVVVSRFHIELLT
jgi:hypothetical protein